MRFLVLEIRDGILGLAKSWTLYIPSWLFMVRFETMYVYLEVLCCFNKKYVRVHPLMFDYTVHSASYDILNLDGVLVIHNFVSETRARDTEEISSTPTNGVSVSSAIFALCNIAWARMLARGAVSAEMGSKLPTYVNMTHSTKYKTYGPQVNVYGTQYPPVVGPGL